MQQASAIQRCNNRSPNSPQTKVMAPKTPVAGTFLLKNRSDFLASRLWGVITYAITIVQFGLSMVFCPTVLRAQNVCTSMGKMCRCVDASVRMGKVRRWSASRRHSLPMKNRYLKVAKLDSNFRCE